MKNKSIWEDVKGKKLNSLDCDMNVDVLIVGGGITGISTLYNLSKSELKTILVEKNKCGDGVTSRSTAKITYLQEKIYMNIRKLVSKDKAQEYLKSQIEAVNIIKNVINKENIPCDLKQVSSYIFTNKEKNIAKIEDECNFLKSNNIEVIKTNKIQDLEVKAALRVKDTYTFHPIKYINYFKNKFKDFIYEDSKLQSFKKDGDYYVSIVNGFKVKSKYLVMATNYPYFIWPFLLPLKSHVETSYIGAKKVNKWEDISAINIDNPTISFRYYSDEKNDYQIYLYNSFMSANIKSINANFKELINNDKFQYIWSNKDIITNDYMPYIGNIYEGDDTLLIGSGYNTWGITNGTLAGKIITDIILKNDNQYIELFSPNRVINLSKIVRLPIDLGSSIKAICKSNKGNVNNKKVIYKKIQGESVAIYKDSAGIEHKVINKCPHMKCGLVFNEVEKTWDCLCHGSRFDIDGKCIEGPSNYDITFRG